MANVTFKNLVAGATYKLHLATKAGPFVDQLQQVPSAPVLSGAADVNGNLTLALTDRIEYLLQGPDARARRVLVSTTKGWPS